MIERGVRFFDFCLGVCDDNFQLELNEAGEPIFVFVTRSAPVLCSSIVAMVMFEGVAV